MPLKKNVKSIELTFEIYKHTRVVLYFKLNYVTLIRQNWMYTYTAFDSKKTSLWNLFE